MKALIFIVAAMSSAPSMAAITVVPSILTGTEQHNPLLDVLGSQQIGTAVDPVVTDTHRERMATRQEIELYVRDMKRWSDRMEACRSGVKAACDAEPRGMPTPPPGVCGSVPNPVPLLPLGFSEGYGTDSILH